MQRFSPGTAVYGSEKTPKSTRRLVVTSSASQAMLIDDWQPRSQHNVIVERARSVGASILWKPAWSDGQKREKRSRCLAEEKALSWVRWPGIHKGERNSCGGPAIQHHGKRLSSWGWPQFAGLTRTTRNTFMVLSETTHRWWRLERTPMLNSVRQKNWKQQNSGLPMNPMKTTFTGRPRGLNSCDCKLPARPA